MARGFNGSSDRIDFTPVTLTYPVTIAGWFYVTSTSSIYRLLSLYVNGSGSTTNVLASLIANYPSGGNLTGQCLVNGTNVLPTATASFSTNTWFHGCMVAVNGTSRTVYLNGGNATTNTVSVATPATNTGSVGALGTSSQYFFSGRAAECGIWNTALTGNEILALAMGVRPYRIRPGSLTGYYPLFGLQSPEPDLSGNANNGTLTGTSYATHAPVTQFTPKRVFCFMGASGTAYSLSGSAGSFTVTGKAAALNVGRKLAASAGTFSVTGEAATLSHGHPLAASPGSFTITGKAATLSHGHPLSAAAGSFTITGEATALSHGHPLSASAGSFTVTGEAATLSHGHPLSAGAGSFAITGETASMHASRSLSAGAGSFTVSGQSATLSKSGAIVLSASPGAFTITGEPATTSWARHMTAAAATFTITGENATFAKGKGLSGSAGTFALTGQTMTVKVGHTMTGSAGSFAISGKALSLSAGRPMSPSAGSFALTGKNLTSYIARNLNASAGVFTVTGQNAQLVSSSQILVSAVFSYAAQFTYVQTVSMAFTHVQSEDVEFG